MKGTFEIMINLINRYQFLSPFITSASGLIFHENYFYLVADDEQALIKLHENLDRPGEMIHIFEEKLPEDPKLRKALKPDFESLTYLPEKGSILCLGSGSKPQREKAVLIDLNNKKTFLKTSNFFQKLNSIFSELNIEGCALSGGKLTFFQRGNGPSNQNAIIKLDLENFLDDRLDDLEIHSINLGKLNNIPLSFTDATFYKNRLFFLAAAEDSNSTYEDGVFSGAVIGELSPENQVAQMRELKIPFKPEGLCIHHGKAYIVTDADDPKVSSGLYEADLPFLTQSLL